MSPDKLKSKRSLERGYLNVRVIRVIKSCETLEQLKVAERYVDLILLRMRDLFHGNVVVDHESVEAYLYLKKYYQTLIMGVESSIYKRDYKKMFRIDFENILVK